jgi:glutathione S-transferase
MSKEEFIAFANSKPLRKEFMLRMGQTGFPEAEMNEALSRLQRSIDRMDVSIRETGGPWLMGRNLTLADIAVMPVIVRLADLGLGKMWADKPTVGRWFEAIQSHPAFKPTYYFGSLLTEQFSWLSEKLAKRA